MADVLIKGMEMPKRCFYCPFREKVNPDDYVCMALNKEFEETFSLIAGRRHKDCPLVSVPPHGRLIDAGELREAMYHNAFEKDSDMQRWDSGCWIRYKMFEKVIEAAPTVIEASEVE